MYVYMKYFIFLLVCVISSKIEKVNAKINVLMLINVVIIRE